ncbi:MAG: ATP-binding protein [Chloroflexota bacterium]|nr:ATP-binding protein [Chloroflexota bacterium]
MAIRWRLTLWFLLILSVVLIVLGLVTNGLISRQLNNEVDDNLRVYSAKVHGTLHADEVPMPLDYDVIHSSLPPINEFASPGLYIQFIDENGNVVVKSDNLGEQELPLDTALVKSGFDGAVDVKTVAAGGGARMRIMVSPMYLQDETLLLEVGQSLQHHDATISQVRWAILIGILGSLVVAGVLGTLLVRRTLAPVEQITRTAQRIEASSDLTRRVGHEGPLDEIGQLAATFDHMIDYLERAFQSQKDFVADASHDLRSPLTVLRGNLDLFELNQSEEDRRESLRSMKAVVERMVDIVNTLLFLAEVESGQNEQRGIVSLKEIVLADVARAEQMTSSCSIITSIPEDLRLIGNAEKLKRLVSNLVDNAIHYTPEGGTITLSLLRDNGWARLEITDTGIGIAAEHLPHIFDRFYRVDKARSRTSGGTGLGLAIIKGIVEQHEGKITVKSEPGNGTTFTVWLKL